MSNTLTITPLGRHRRADGAFHRLRELGARVVDGPMFTGRIHGPWLPTSPEYRYLYALDRKRRVDA